MTAKVSEEELKDNIKRLNWGWADEETACRRWQSNRGGTGKVPGVTSVLVNPTWD